MMVKQKLPSKLSIDNLKKASGGCGERQLNDTAGLAKDLSASLYSNTKLNEEQKNQIMKLTDQIRKITGG